MQPRSAGKITEELDAPPHPIVTMRAMLHAQDPAVRILPAHDRVAWRAIFGAPGQCVGAAPRQER
jgi:hypothetical protein